MKNYLNCKIGKLLNDDLEFLSYSLYDPEYISLQLINKNSNMRLIVHINTIDKTASCGLLTGIDLDDESFWSKTKQINY